MIQEKASGLEQHFTQFLVRHGASADAAAVVQRLVAAVENGDVAMQVTPAERKLLLDSKVVGDPFAALPLVLDAADRLYVRRFYQDEQLIASGMRSRAAQPLKKPIEDAQERAVETARRARLVIVTGGPGTGKTTVAARILAAILEEEPDIPCLLAAPTGKAASRLQQQIQDGFDALKVAPETRSHVYPATTVHRMLGARGAGGRFCHGAENPLPAGLVLIDEASMVPLPLMARIFEALPDGCRLVLLGDSDQLASVEAGAVFADLTVAAREEKSLLRPNLVVLDKNYRFDSRSPVARWSAAVREGNADAVRELAAESGDNVVRYARLPARNEAREWIQREVMPHALQILRAETPEEALARMQQHRVLCAVRGGPFGVELLNHEIGRKFRETGKSPTGQPLFRGLPLIVLRNDSSLRLANGDTGVIFSSGNDEPLAAYFPGEGGTVRRIPIARLPAWEAAFAMTVHKSQGSEFKEVTLLLPETWNPVLTRELLYTGITRAREKVRIFAPTEVLLETVRTRQARVSGLVDALASD